MEISHLWQSLDTDSDGKVRMEDTVQQLRKVLQLLRGIGLTPFSVTAVLVVEQF